jgi:hypothetical protein
MDRGEFCNLYRGQVPANIKLQDVVNAAAEDDLRMYFTRPHESFVTIDASPSTRSASGDGYYFFADPTGDGYIACLIEMGRIAATRKTLDISDAFKEYMDYYFWQLQASPVDSRWTKSL